MVTKADYKHVRAVVACKMQPINCKQHMHASRTEHDITSGSETKAMYYSIIMHINQDM